MAAPFVTGVAALLLGQQPSRSVTDVKAILAQSSDKVGTGYGSDPYSTCAGCTWSSAFGYGRLDLYRALTAVGPVSSGFQVAVAPSTATIDATRSAIYTVSVTGSGTVDLSVSGLPSGVTGVIAPSKVIAPGSARLVVSVPPETAAGTYTFTVTGTGGDLVSTASATLVVPAADFTIAISPGERYALAGLSATYQVDLSTQSGFTGLVDLSVDGLPPGATALLQPSSAPVPGVAALTLVLPLTTPPGSYTVTVTGRSGALVHQATTQLVVK